MDAAPRPEPLDVFRSEIVRRWFGREFPGGPTPIQSAAWPSVAERKHALIIAPTGGGKTLAAFLAILDRLLDEHTRGGISPGIRCLYVSPLRSLGYDIERNLAAPLEAMARLLGVDRPPVRIGVRTGDTSARERRAMLEAPPHLLITTPESLSLLLSQPRWCNMLAGVETLIVDEVHALMQSKRGADLAVTLERASAACVADPVRVGLSATCGLPDAVARFLVGPHRRCDIIQSPKDPRDAGTQIKVESLLAPDEQPHRGLTYGRLLRRLHRAVAQNRTTIVFANTRAFSEKITHDLRLLFSPQASPSSSGVEPKSIVVHHSALSAERRRDVEAGLRSGVIRAVVTSTSLELGIDIGTIDEVIQVGLPGSVSRLIQRVGRSGRRLGTPRRGRLLSASTAELAAAAVTAAKARCHEVEPFRAVRNPLDVLCQQLLAMACSNDITEDDAFALVRDTAPFSELPRRDFEDCLAFLAGELAGPAGGASDDDRGTVTWTAPRIWRQAGRFGVRGRRVMRWLWANIGTIVSHDVASVVAEGVPLGTIEADFAARLQRGDRFLLDGRPLVLRSRLGPVVHAGAAGGSAGLPRWLSDLQSLSCELAQFLSELRESAVEIAVSQGTEALRRWLMATYALGPREAEVLEIFFEAQAAISEIPPARGVLIEESPDREGYCYAFHCPLNRSASEAAARAVGTRLARKSGRNFEVSVADLGWTIVVPTDIRFDAGEIMGVLHEDGFERDVLEGVDRGELVARRFQYVAATALMVLKNPEGGRRRVGGMDWVSQRLYPLVRAACPDHPLLRETRREVLEDILDCGTARAFFASRPPVRFRQLDGPSPFTAAWLAASTDDALRFESPVNALRRLSDRLHGRVGAATPAAATSGGLER